MAYITAAYYSTSSFRVQGDRTPNFRQGQRLRLFRSGASPVEVTVQSSAYESGQLLTTVTVAPLSVTPQLYRVELGLSYCEPGVSGNVAEHPHQDRFSGSYMCASRLTDPIVTNVLAIPIPDAGDTLAFLRANLAGDGWELFSLMGAANALVGINDAGDEFETKEIVGTTDQIDVTHTAGTITLSAPQDIATTSSPEFAGLTLTLYEGVLLSIGGDGGGEVMSLPASNALEVLRRDQDNLDYEWALVTLAYLDDVDLAYPDDGDILMFSGDSWTNHAAGDESDVFQVVGGLPTWSPLDGDVVDIDWNPTWSTPNGAVTEAGGSADALAAHLDGIDTAIGVRLEYLADVRVEYSDANTVKLTGVPGSSKKIMVNGALVSVASDLTLDTDSAAEFVIVGTSTVSKSTALDSYTGGSYNAYGLHYLYVANTAAAFNFSGYDRRSKIFVSAEAPTTGGYLSATGDGVNARCVGMFAVNASRQFDHAMCVASLYNALPLSRQVTGTGGTWDTLTLDAIATVSGCDFYVVVPDDWVYTVSGLVSLRNEDTDPCEFTIVLRNDTSVLATGHGRAGTASGYASQIDHAITTAQTSTSNQVVRVNVAVTPTGVDSSPTVRGDYAQLVCAVHPKHID